MNFTVRLVLAGLIAMGYSLLAVGGEPLFGSVDFLPSPQHPVGYRGDWTGRYPGAEPPATLTTSNLVWKVDVGDGEASPIVVGSRIFLLTDGIHLRCLDRETGQWLWQRNHHVDKTDTNLWAVEEYVLARHQLRRLEAPARDPATARTPPDPEKKAALQKQMADLMQLDVLKNVVNLSGQWGRGGPKSYEGALTGAVATPCSDGRAVYAWLPTGVIAVYDLAGKPLWHRVLGEKRAAGGWYGGQVAPAPLLADNKLVIHYDKIYCLDPATGKTIWEAPRKILPIPSPIAGQRNGVWYITLGSGQILRLADGKYVFGEPDSSKNDYITVSTPIFYDDCFCWYTHAMQLPETADGQPKILWQLDRSSAGQLDGGAPAPDKVGKLTDPRGLGWHGYAAIVWHDGVVDYQSERSVYSRLDARTGRLLFAKPLRFASGGGCGGEVYGGLTLAGKQIFAVSSGGGYLAVRADIGSDVTLAGESQFQYSHGKFPVFHSRRVYLHAGEWLYCFEKK